MVKKTKLSKNKIVETVIVIKPVYVTIIDAKAPDKDIKGRVRRDLKTLTEQQLLFQLNYWNNQQSKLSFLLDNANEEADTFATELESRNILLPDFEIKPFSKQIYLEKQNSI